MNDYVAVDGARIWFQVTGSGPVLLISQSGEGDADRTVDLVKHLASRFTVVTYDRRGLSRSTVDDRNAAGSIRQHIGARGAVGSVRPLAGEGERERVGSVRARVEGGAAADSVPRRVVAAAGSVVRRVDERDGAGSIRRHADDAVAVLRQVTDAPADMLGLSLGAVIGLHMSRAHPHAINRLIAHEPIALPFLSPADREVARAKLANVRRVHQAEGWRAAAAEVASVLGIDPRNQTTEPGITAFPFTEQRAANFEYFLATDLDAALNDTLLLSDVPRNGRIIPAVGATSPQDGFDYLAALALAGHLGVEATPFPGGHNGNLTHPRAFAEQVRALLG
ncbi:alpha/beta hydrolase [Asanoa sp. NPDC049518]|uniref:alpha/beta fold hydrolase n=1 Tax=unclassified Asanoa TaxID=2685164 RepID=UPI003426CF6C